MGVAFRGGMQALSRSRINLNRPQKVMPQLNVLHKVAAALLVIGNISSVYAMSSSDDYDGINPNQPDNTTRVSFGCAPGYTSPPEGGNICMPSTDKRKKAQEECAKSIENRYDTVNINTQLYREILYLYTESKMK